MQGSLQSSALPAELSKESQGPALHHTLHAPIHIIPTAIAQHNNASPPTPHPDTLTSNTTTPSMGLHALTSLTAPPEKKHTLPFHSLRCQKRRTHIPEILLSIQLRPPRFSPLLMHLITSHPLTCLHSSPTTPRKSPHNINFTSSLRTFAKLSRSVRQPLTPRRFSTKTSKFVASAAKRPRQPTGMGNLQLPWPNLFCFVLLTQERCHLLFL